MTHEEVRRLLALAAAGALNAAEARQVERHASECEQCGRELKALYTVTDALQAIPAPPVPRGLASRAKSRVRVQQGAVAEQRTSTAILVFLVLFAWTVTLLPWIMTSASGRSLLVTLTLSTLFAWVTGGVTVIVLLFRRAGWRTT